MSNPVGVGRSDYRETMIFILNRQRWLAGFSYLLVIRYTMILFVFFLIQLNELQWLRLRWVCNSVDDSNGGERGEGGRWNFISIIKWIRNWVRPGGVWAGSVAWQMNSLSSPQCWCWRGLFLLFPPRSDRAGAVLVAAGTEKPSRDWTGGVKCCLNWTKSVRRCLEKIRPCHPTCSLCLLANSLGHFAHLDPTWECFVVSGQW